MRAILLLVVVAVFLPLLIVLLCLRAASAPLSEPQGLAGVPATVPPRPMLTTTSSTTTIVPVRRVVATKTTAPIARFGTGACGGSLPPCTVLRRESGGNLRAVSPIGMCGTRRNPRRCYGKWQWDLPTWNNYRGYANPIDAPESVQDAKARELWNNGKGCSHWGVC